MSTKRSQKKAAKPKSKGAAKRSTSSPSPLRGRRLITTADTEFFRFQRKAPSDITLPGDK